MAATQLSGSTAIVTGASRGFGRGIATALAGAGARVVGVARDRAQLEAVRAELGDAFFPVAADASDPSVAARLLEAHRPQILVLNAGASPLMQPLQHHTWETFSRNWEVDVQHVFHWTREALLLPLAPGSTVVAFSSGAAVAGSPLSGGYAGAKGTIRFIASYAGMESARSGLGIRVVSVLPKLTSATDLGAPAVAAYAEREGVDVATYQQRMGPALTPEQVGATIAGLAADRDQDQPAYMLTPGGLAPVPA